eukprot:Nitzschia sp. Nitz4//NODE_474_length_16687_cov_99.124940//15038//15994//NITZ4_additional_000070-RA//1//CDS//3329531937//7041//frame0
MFFASGLIPSIQLLIFEVLPKQFANTKKKKSSRQPLPASSTHLDDLLSVGLSLFFLSVAMVLYPSPDEEQNGWGIVCGKTLFEAGLIYFVTRVLFFVPNPNDKVRQLREEVSRLKQSMAMGLADGYYWNLVQEIAMDIRDANGPQGTLKLCFPRQGEELKKVKRFYILIPRHLDFTKEDPIKELIGHFKGSGHFKDCKIEKSPTRAESTRVKWVTDVILNPSQAPAGSTSPPPYQDGILIDIPTTITALIMNLRADSASGDNINREIFQEEVSSFAYRLAWQLKRQQLENYVAVVEMENSLDLTDKIRDIHAHANATP